MKVQAEGSNRQDARSRVESSLRDVEAELAAIVAQRGAVALDGREQALETLERRAQAAERRRVAPEAALVEADRRAAEAQRVAEAEAKRAWRARTLEVLRERVEGWRRFEARLAEAEAVLRELEASYSLAARQLHGERSPYYHELDAAQRAARKALGQVAAARPREVEERVLAKMEHRTRTEEMSGE